MNNQESDQQPILAFFLAPTDILQVNYDKDTELTYIYIKENKGRTNNDLIVYEFDINTLMSKSEDIIEPVKELLEEFYFKDYTMLEKISKKTNIGRLNEKQLDKFLSFNDIYGFHNMTEVAMRLYENCIERVMLKSEDIANEYLESIVKLIRKEESFDTHTRPVDIDWIESNTVFKRVDEKSFDKRLIFSDDFIHNLLRYEEEEFYISYERFCEIIFDFDYYLSLREAEEEHRLYD
ncbi:hypothetical protein [Staphylococcus aureus]|uniref:hypothetical protein n=1 Tax=Staphylococcus aureus TaxID=1280 RepID=UPI0018ECC5CA|nr:hypothetical protein [Staphylococcus aureus]MBJ6239736.1 hypothetical protein [Staphylococcus aureus]